MTNLAFRLPGRAQPLGAWLSQLLPEIDRSARRRLIEEGRVRLDGVVADRSGQLCPEGAMVAIEGVPDGALAHNDRGRHVLWEALVDAPPWHGGGAVEASGGRPIEFVCADRREGLARLVLDASRGDGGDPRGEASGDGAIDARALCEVLARASMPVVGDLERGGLAVAGGARIAPLAARSSGSSGVTLAHAAERGPESLDWPEVRAWREEAGVLRASREANDEQCDETSDEESGRFVVSDETARALAGGHPWILADSASDPASRFRRGALVRVVERKGRGLGWAHVEADPKLAARIWALGDIPPQAIPSVEARVARALARRRGLLVDVESSGTNAFRLIHGEADSLPGLFVDRLGPLLRVLVTGWSSEGFRERALAALRTQLPLTPEGEAWSVLEVLHLRRPGTSNVERVRWLEGGLDVLAATGLDPSGQTMAVRERGLSFLVDPGWDTPRRSRPGYGLFVDQRENRERVASRVASGGRWLNLFAHTGAFSVACLAAGAESVVSVDLSAAYLERLESNLRVNQDCGVDPSRHETVKSDARRYLEELPGSQRFRGIVIDPPTAAAAGRRFWSVRQDLEPLLGQAIEHLERDGVLLVTQNRAGPPLGIDRALERAAQRARRELATLDQAPAGIDCPSLPGFPEGEPFEGWLVSVR